MHARVVIGMLMEGRILMVSRRRDFVVFPLTCTVGIKIHSLFLTANYIYIDPIVALTRREYRFSIVSYHCRLVDSKMNELSINMSTNSPGDLQSR